MSQLPKHERSLNPPPMHFQQRDGYILKALHEYDGLLSKRQLKAMFWPQASERAMEMRLSRLYHQGYLDWPNALQWRSHPIPESICWLGWKGILWLANEAGIENLPDIATPTENKLRQLVRDLRRHGLRWQREPRWGQLRHDLAVVDFRLAVERSAREIPDLTIEKWVLESDFWIKTDKVEYTLENKHGAPKPIKRGVRPDGYFVLVDKLRLGRGLPGRARFLVEIDMATHDLGSFAAEKALAGWHYIHSQAYKERFGDNNGCWLVVTTTEARQQHLMTSIQQAIGLSANYLITTLGQLDGANTFSTPIWRRLGSSAPVKLVSG